MPLLMIDLPIGMINYFSIDLFFGCDDQMKGHTVTPFKFTAVKVRRFDIMTYSLPFNFAVSYQNYFTVSYLSNIFDNI